jgi:acyl dehydratase
MRVFNDVAELEAAVGTHLGYSDWHTITQEQINGFAEHTGDDRWIHVDPERATEGPFGGTIAHGYLTLSLVPKFLWQIYQIEGVKLGVNYGADKLRFPSPVPAGSRVRAGVELVSVKSGEGTYRVVTRVKVEREGGDKPACVVDTVSVMVA